MLQERQGGAPPAARIAVFGLGYVGCVSAACFASVGHSVIGVDRDRHKVDSIAQGRAPFYEPELDELVAQGIASGRLRATGSVAEAVESSDYAFLCVGTPSERNGNLSLEQVRRVCEEMAPLLARRERPFTVVIRSTVFPGTCRDVVRTALGEQTAVAVVSNPEFLREGSAVRDFFDPSLIVVGGEEPARSEVGGLYAALGVEPALVTLETAEMIKYACNAFHALKIGFANEIGALAASLGVPAGEVMETVCRDKRLNISAAYLRPGFAFGGSCLPKDLRALNYRASRLDLKLPLLSSILPSNEEHLRRAIDAVLETRAERIGIYGLAFKEDTDDLRESPAVALIEYLIGKGRQVKIHDPHIQIDAIYGSNRSFALSAIPHLGKLMDGRFDNVILWADLIVAPQKLPEAWRPAVEASGKPLLELAVPEASRAQRATG